MSKYEQKEGQGSLFKNEKTTAENQPDYNGNIMQGGTLYELAGWVKETKAGKKMLSLKISNRQLPTNKIAPPTPSAPSDDLPF